MFQEEYKRILADYEDTYTKDGIVRWAESQNIPRDVELMEFLAFSLIARETMERSRAARESYQETLDRTNFTSMT